MLMFYMQYCHQANAASCSVSLSSIFISLFDCSTYSMISLPIIHARANYSSDFHLPVQISTLFLLQTLSACVEQLFRSRLADKNLQSAQNKIHRLQLATAFYSDRPNKTEQPHLLRLKVVQKRRFPPNKEGYKKFTVASL